MLYQQNKKRTNKVKKINQKILAEIQKILGRLGSSHRESKYYKALMDRVNSLTNFNVSIQKRKNQIKDMYKEHVL